MDAESFLGEAERLAKEGWRLALVNATGLQPQAGSDEGEVDLIWSFEKGGTLVHLRERVAHGDPVPSLSGLFGSAFLYENEIRELFGVEITGLTVDFRGELYRTSQKVPFSGKAIKQRLAARSKVS